jgi:Fe-S oxidoreductase
MRAEAFAAGERGTYAHDGILQELARIQAATQPDPARGRRLPTWLAGDMRVSEGGDTFYFVGCLPFFDVVFANLGVKTLDIARSAVRLLNRAGVVPIVSGAERCCGADLLLAGDTTSFRRLAERNTEMIRASGAKRVVFTCAECYSAFKNDYPAIVGPLPFQTLHITELLADMIARADGRGSELTFEPSPELVTYHDPCRMCRYLGVHEAPRAVLSGVPGLQLVEMEDNRERAVCCGSTAWVNCSGCAKLVQREKLRQARETGAGVMLTTCPKCQIHLTCAARDLDAGQAMKVEDVISWLGKSLT